MKEIWTLIIKTQLTPVVRAFYSFSEAKDALREALKKLTFKKNEMFDGEGKITRLKQYIDKTVDFKRESDDGILTKEVLNKVQNALCDVFAGKETMADIEEGIYTDYFVAFEYKEGVIRFYGDDDGPCNGYDPTLYTNMFDMTEEKDYFLYIEDAFGQDVYYRCYVDLKKTELN